MKLNKSSSSLLTMAIAVGVAVFASLPLTAVAATWTNQAGGYWLDTNN